MNDKDQNQEILTPEQQKKQEKQESRKQTMLALRVVLSAYLVYLGYDLIRKTVTSEEPLGWQFYLYIGLGVVFAIAGIFVLLDCWKLKKARDAEEREAKRRAMEAEAETQNPDFPSKLAQESAEDEQWGYRPEGNETDSTDADKEDLK